MPDTKRLLFINQHYWPDVASTGQHLTDLAEYLAAQGHDVSVLCSRGRYLSGTLKAPRREVRKGVTIHRVRSSSFGRGSHLGRLTDYATFFGQVLLRTLLGRRRYDYVFTLTTPPLLSVAGFLLHKLKGQRYGIWSMDLHPDAEAAVGLLPEGRVLRALHGLNNAAYRHADVVVDLGAHMKRRLREKGVAAEQLRTIPVWNKKTEIHPVPKHANPLARRLGLQDKFVVMYSGNAGLAHRFDEVLGAMQALRDHPRVFFLFVGGGPRRREILSFATDRRIGNFRYLDYFPRDQLKYSLSIGDVHLLTLRSDMAGIAVPSKLYGIMAAGRPVVMVGPGASEPAATIREEQAGVVIDPEARSDPTGHLVEHLLDLYACDRRRARIGSAARAAFLDSYEQEVCCAQWHRLLTHMNGRNGRS